MTSLELDQVEPTPTEQAPLPLLGTLLRMTFEKWYADNIPRHAAALAFYTLFAIAPLVLLATAIMGALYGRDIAEAQLVAQVEQYIHSPETAALVQTILDNTLPTSSPWWFTAAAILVLIYGASSVFGELQIVLNLIWGAPLTLRDDIWGIVWGRLLAVLMVVLSGFLLFFALAIATWSDAANDWATRQLHTGGYEEWSYALVLFLLMALVFALIYKFVPHVTIVWHDVIIGAVATAFLISIARLLITWYLNYSRMGLMFGTAGSLVIMLLWAYYSAQIFFLGAEFTHVYGRTYGTRWRQQPTSATPVCEPPDDQEHLLAAIATKTQEQADAEIITAEITALKPLALEPDAPVTLEVSNEQPKPKKRMLRVPKLAHVRQRVRQLKTRLAQIWALPLTITRPIREIIVAVSVIGALSLAALVGLPWRKRRPDDTKSLNQNTPMP